jgi:FG-GAP repeat
VIRYLWSVALGMYLITAPAQGALGDELFKINASDAAAGDGFGISIGFDGDRAVIGARGVPPFLSGAAYVFDTNTGGELGKLIGLDTVGGDEFGWSASVSGNLAVVGAPEDDDGGNNTGSAYLFDLSTNLQLNKLNATVAGSGDNFGYSVAISGTTVLIGARDDDDGGNDSGSAYIFDTSTGAQVHKLTASDPVVDAKFGRSVAVDDMIAVVGSADNGPGSAYVFDTTTGNELTKLMASDGANDDRFGWSVGVSSTAIVVGAPGDDFTTGSVYVYDPITGNELWKLTADDASQNDHFGYSVSVDGNMAIVGAWGDDDAGESSGAAYVFDLTSGTQLVKLTASDAMMDAEFGWTVAISGDTAVVGQFNCDNICGIPGSAYMFEVPEPASVTFLVVGGLGLVRRWRDE